MPESLEVGSVRVVFVGASRHTTLRQAAVNASGYAGRTWRETPPGESVEPESVCFVSLPVGQVADESVRLLRGGCHVFLDVPQTPSLRDLQRLDRTADEAGVTIGISRPLRYASGLSSLGGRATIAILETEFGEEPDAWTCGLNDTLDLCMYLCGTSTARRVEASSGRRDSVWPVLGAFSIRFDNGTLAVASLRRAEASTDGTRCIISNGADVQEREVALTADALRTETEDYLAHIASGATPPVSITDALACARLLDHVMGLLR